jgi:glycosyltransferase involved in cell wall biosynthesis
MTAAKTTVVVPVWDDYVGDPLLRAVDSLRGDNGAARIVLVDNASRVPVPKLDGTEIVRSPSRLSLGAARNLGIANVTTPYVVVWDADDVMLPGTLQALEHAIESDPKLAAFGAAILEDPAGARHRWPRRWIAVLVRAPRAFALINCAWSVFPTTGATIMRTELVRDAGGYSDSDSGDDWSLGAALGFRGRFGWSERPGRVYLLHHQSIWARHMSARHQLEHARAIRSRLRADAAVGRHVKLMLPLLGVAQRLAVGLHVVVKRRRGTPR